MLIKIEQCKNAKTSHANTSFWQSNTGQWRFDIACRCFSDCKNRSHCRGITEGMETPEDAIEAWNDLIKK